MRHRPELARFLVLTWTLLGVACAGGDRTLEPPTGPGPDTTGTVQRGALTVRVTVASDDAGLGVTLTRETTVNEAPRRAETDAAGAVRFGNLLQGVYQVSVERLVSPDERARLDLADRDVSAIVGSARLTVTPGEATVTVETIASRPGALLISEVWPYRHLAADYRQGTYLEVYNNSDSTVYLDGMLLGASSGFPDENVGGNPRCEQYAAIRNADDALGVTGVLYRFPGSGRDHPIAAGQAVVIAEDAVDHRAFSPHGVDLSRADFETIGDTRDIDNPAVPNLERLQGTAGLDGRGWPFGAFFPGMYVLARRPDAALERRPIAVPEIGDAPFIPRALVLDVFGQVHAPQVRTLFASLGIIVRDCQPFLANAFERDPAPLADANRWGEPIAYARRVAAVTPDGRVVLQRTRTSARDWVYGPPATPGVVR